MCVNMCRKVNDHKVTSVNLHVFLDKGDIVVEFGGDVKSCLDAIHKSTGVSLLVVHMPLQFTNVQGAGFVF